MSDRDFETLLESSSLGALGAQLLRERTSVSQARVVRRIGELRDRLKASDSSRGDTLRDVRELLALLDCLGLGGRRDSPRDVRLPDEHAAAAGDACFGTVARSGSAHPRDSDLPASRSAAAVFTGALSDLYSARPESGAPGPVVRRMQLGSQLKQLRQAQGITLHEAGREIRVSETKISRMELGRVSFKKRDVANLLTLYGVTGDAERTALLALAEEANSPGWWQSYSDVLPNWGSTYVGLEGAASRIQAYEVQFVHALLQTEEYARAVCRLGPVRQADVERRVALRLRRQQLLVADEAPELHVILDEAVLRRPYGSRAVMRKQLQHLIDVSERPNVRLQVMPFQSSGHPVTSGPFTLLSFSLAHVPDIVYVEQLSSALYLDKPQEVAQYAAVLGDLGHDNPPPERSRDLLRSLLLAA